MIRTVLIDDEPPARRKLRHLLAGETDISIIGEAGSGAEAVELLNRDSRIWHFWIFSFPIARALTWLNR